MDQSTTLALVISFALAGFVLLYQRKGNEKQTVNYSLKNFATNLTASAKNGELSPLLEREKELERTIHILLRKTKNNPLLIGEPGVGKTAIVNGLANKIAQGLVPSALKNKEVYALNLADLISETKFRGELENKVSKFLNDLEQRSRQAILFIDEVHMIVQAGGSDGALNLTDIMKPALARGDLQIIGATTWGEYAKYIKPDAALDRRFQPVLVDEPKPAQALSMLKGLRQEYETFHQVKIPDTVLKAAVALSAKYIKTRFLPDKALDLIDEAAAKVSIEAPEGSYAKHIGVLHGAIKKTKNKTVSVADIEEVVEQWKEHALIAKRKTV